MEINRNLQELDHNKLTLDSDRQKISLLKDQLVETNDQVKAQKLLLEKLKREKDQQQYPTISIDYYMYALVGLMAQGIVGA